MATNPSINSQTLATGGQNSRFGQPRSRITVSAMPSVGGAFVQRFGLGPQMIAGGGIITAANHAAIKAAIRTVQNAANHAPGTYVDTDGVSHTNCVLLEYQQAGRLQPNGSGAFTVAVRWTILKQVSS